MPVHEIESSLPSAVDAERIVLGTILLDNLVYSEAAAVLAPEDFFLDSHRRIFVRMADLGERGDPIDIVTLQHALSEHKELEAVGGVSYLVSLEQGTVRRASVLHHAREIAEKSRLRKIVHACNATVAGILEQTGESSEFHIGGLEESLLAVQMASRKTIAQPIADLVAQVLHELELQASQEGLVGMPTGLRPLDEATAGGFRPGELVVVGALPGRGKSAFGLQITLANAEAGNPTLIFSLEMSNAQLIRRLLAARSGILACQIRNPKWIGKDKWPRVASTGVALRELPIWIDDSPSLSIRELVARARLCRRRFGIRLVVVDYLRPVRAPGRDIREQVGNVADALRVLAKTEDIAVVLLSQLRRPESLNQPPSMIELKESGDIESHAHVVLLLHRPVDNQGHFTHEDQIIIGKQREGVTGPIPVKFMPDRLQFTPRADENTATD